MRSLAAAYGQAIAVWPQLWTPAGALPVTATRGPARNQDGIALVLVLWITILLTVIASGFA